MTTPQRARMRRASTLKGRVLILRRQCAGKSTQRQGQSPPKQGGNQGRLRSGGSFHPPAKIGDRLGSDNDGLPDVVLFVVFDPDDLRTAAITRPRVVRYHPH